MNALVILEEVKDMPGYLKATVPRLGDAQFFVLPDENIERTCHHMVYQIISEKLRLGALEPKDDRTDVLNIEVVEKDELADIEIRFAKEGAPL